MGRVGWGNLGRWGNLGIIWRLPNYITSVNSSLWVLLMVKSTIPAQHLRMIWLSQSQYMWSWAEKCDLYWNGMNKPFHFLKNGLENKRIETLSPKRIHVMKNALPFRKKTWNVRWGNLGIKTLRAGNTIFWTLSREIYPKRTRPRFKRSGWLEKSRCTW